jgi:hypothetical protein
MFVIIPIENCHRILYRILPKILKISKNKAMTFVSYFAWV